MSSEDGKTKISRGVKSDGLKVKAFIKDMGETMHSISKKNMGVEYKTIQRIVNGDAVSMFYTKKLADFLARDVAELLLNPDDKEQSYTEANRIDSMNDIYKDKRYGHYRKINKHVNLIQKRMYECSPSSNATEAIFNFIDIFYSELEDLEGNTLEENIKIERNKLASIANVENFIEILKREGISIFYCSYAHRYIDIENFSIEEWIDVGMDYAEKNTINKKTLVPAEKKIEMLIFKYQETPSQNLKIIIPEGYTREGLKDDYLKIYQSAIDKQDNPEDFKHYIDIVSKWIDHQNKYTNWFFNELPELNPYETEEILLDNNLSGKYFLNFTDERLKDTKYNTANINKSVSIEEINFIKKKEDAMK